jgi:NAD(P)-dependent dehydrogenase (short-subunit alcohol dehydrogenase family)
VEAGPIKTAMTAGFIADPAIAQAAVKQTPQGEWGTPMDIGKACVFLATDDAQWITGSA